VAALYDITSWNAQLWYNTGGTRAKKYIQSRDGKYYFFKRSQLKPGKDYKFEFWSEIIASQVGQFLGFKVLGYDIAIDGDIMGCICASMIDPDKEELIEGLRYLQAYDNTFTPEKTSLRKLYSFQLIEKTLAQFRLERFMEGIIEILVFDSIIGNSDRHQENWAFIDEYSGFTELVKIFPELSDMLFGVEAPKSLAPIYDNGSSLGRELSDDKVVQLLQDEAQIERYIDRGTAEIHWNDQKINHFDLISHLLKSPYQPTVKMILKRVESRFDERNIAQIVGEIDNLVPSTHIHYIIPPSRKQLIIKMICSRVVRLKKLLNEGI
jgi:hypothetical protein